MIQKLVIGLLLSFVSTTAFGGRDPWLGSTYVCDTAKEGKRFQFKLEFQQIYNGTPLGYQASELTYKPGTSPNFRWQFVETYDLAPGTKMHPENLFLFKFVSRPSQNSLGPIYIESSYETLSNKVVVRRFTETTELQHYEFPVEDCQWIR